MEPPFSQARRGASECHRARDAKRDIPVPPFALRSATSCKCRGTPRSGATASALRAYARAPTANGLTVCRMREHIASAGYGTSGPFATAARRSRLHLPRTTRLVLRTSLAGSAGCATGHPSYPCEELLEARGTGLASVTPSMPRRTTEFSAVWAYNPIQHIPVLYSFGAAPRLRANRLSCRFIGHLFVVTRSADVVA